MTAERAVARAVANQLAVVLMLVGALSALAVGVEQAHRGIGPALQLAALRTPGLIVLVLPALVAAAAGLAAARLESRGERVSLEAAGASPLATGRGALVIGLVVGIAGFVGHGWAVPLAESAAESLAPSTVAPWVWVQEGAWRPSDRTLVRVADGRITAVEAAELPDDRVARRREEQSPWRARWTVLAVSDALIARVEVWGRLGRALGCGLLAMMGWLPLSHRPRRQAGMAALCGVGWLAGDIVARAAATQGLVGPALGGLLASLTLGAGLAVWARRSHRR